jgi:ketosteroid isomerase-like protein
LTEMVPNPHQAPSENVEVLRKAYEAFSRGRFPLDHLDPGVVWDESRRQVDPAVHQGHAGARRVFESRLEVFEDFRVEAEQFFDLGDRVLVFSRVRGRGKGSGADVDAQVASLYTFRGEKAVRVEYFGDREEALRSAGIEATDRVETADSESSERAPRS